MDPKVIFVILNCNGGEDTCACLQSIGGIDYPDYRVIVVDNASSDGSPDLIARRFPSARIVRSDRNVGYDAGNNIGIEAALEEGADAVFLLNNDTTLAPDILRHLVSAASSLPGAGVLSPKIYFYDEPNRLWSAGCKKKYSTTGRLLVYTQEGKGEIDEGQYDRAGKIDGVNGAAMYFKSEVFRDAGVFDGEYFIYNDEFDICNRARKKGWDCYFVPRAKVWHKVSRTMGGANSPSLHYLWTRNWLLLTRKQTNLLLWPLLYYAYIRECYWIYCGLREKGEIAAAEAALAGGLAAVRNSFGPPPKTFAPPRWLGRAAARRFERSAAAGRA